MGQKTSPTGFRLVIRKNWKSNWYANKQDYGRLIAEDTAIRKRLITKPCCVGTSNIVIKRMSDKIEVTIHTARPGLVIGKKGAEIDVLKQELHKMTGKEVWIEVEEVKRPDLDAKLVAEGIAKQIERRVAFRKVLKKAMQAAMDAGAAGIKVQLSGRIGGAEIARTEWYKEGRVPLHTLRADLDYATARAETTYGTIGVKVIINKGDQPVR
ncbi:MAG: 30S ribosomal protein S3 [Chlamydiales bacterium]|nr:30S ribosomal protein S3 [Chlamydiales bacterium]